MSKSRDEANRLAKYRSVYAGALAELGQGEHLGLLPKDHPGIVLTRDLIEKILLTRAECNALYRIMLDKGIVPKDEGERIFAEEYAFLADAHERITGYRATQDGLTMDVASAKRALQHQAERMREDA